MMNIFLISTMLDWCFDSVEHSLDCRFSPPPSIVAGAIIDWIEIDGMLCRNTDIKVDQVHQYYIRIGSGGKYGHLYYDCIGRIGWHV